MDFTVADIVRTLLVGTATILGWGIGNALIGFLSSFRQDFKELTDSVKALNVNVAVVIERLDGHEARIQKIEDKI